MAVEREWVGGGRVTACMILWRLGVGGGILIALISSAVDGCVCVWGGGACVSVFILAASGSCCMVCT